MSRSISCLLPASSYQQQPLDGAHWEIGVDGGHQGILSAKTGNNSNIVYNSCTTGADLKNFKYNTRTLIAKLRG